MIVSEWEVIARLDIHQLTGSFDREQKHHVDTQWKAARSLWAYSFYEFSLSYRYGMLYISKTEVKEKFLTPYALF